MSSGQRRIAAMILEDPHWAMQTNVDGARIPRRRQRAHDRPICEKCRLRRIAGSEVETRRRSRRRHTLSPSERRSRTTAPRTWPQRGRAASPPSWRNGSVELIPADIERAAEAMHRARRVDCFGTGATSNFLAQDMQARLFRLGIVTNAFSDAHLQLVAAATETRDDVLFAISFVGRMPALLEAVAVGKSHGATISP